MLVQVEASFAAISLGMSKAQVDQILGATLNEIQTTTEETLFALGPAQKRECTPA